MPQTPTPSDWKLEDTNKNEAKVTIRQKEEVPDWLKGAFDDTNRVEVKDTEAEKEEILIDAGEENSEAEIRENKVELPSVDMKNIEDREDAHIPDWLKASFDDSETSTDASKEDSENGEGIPSEDEEAGLSPDTNMGEEKPKKKRRRRKKKPISSNTVPDTKSKTE